MLRSDDPIMRRRALKNLSYSLTGRALWRFLDTYLIRGGWLDGTAGFHYALMISMYEYWIELKIRELELEWTGRTEQTVDSLLKEPASGLDRQRHFSDAVLTSQQT